MAVSAASVARSVGIPFLLSWEKLSTGVSYNLLSPKVYANPYPVYTEMRTKDPVHWSELARAWFLTRYADVAAILKDSRFSVVGMCIDPILRPEVIGRINDVILEAGDYFERHIELRRKNPGDDLLSSLITAEEQGERLASDELLSLLFLFLAAGTETTTNLTCNGLYTILRHPDQLERLRNDPTLIESAIEEFLRFETPVQVTGRVAHEDVEVGGKMIRKGQPVGLLLGAANRDPDQFPDPDRLDIGRTPNRHDAFSFGIHFCVGAPLGRAEAAIAIETVLRRLPNLKLQSETPHWRPTMNNRGLQTLPVTF